MPLQSDDILRAIRSLLSRGVEATTAADVALRLGISPADDEAFKPFIEQVRHLSVTGEIHFTPARGREGGVITEQRRA